MPLAAEEEDRSDTGFAVRHSVQTLSSAPLTYNIPFNVRDGSPRRVRFYPDSGLNDETRARLVAACWRFAAVSYVTSYPPETP